jgi:hypothetical protein
VGKVLLMDVANRCAWLATPDDSHCDSINISIRQIRGLIRAGMITMRFDQNTTDTTFVISAKGQAEVRRIKQREAQSLAKRSGLSDAGAKEERRKHQGKPKMRPSSEAVSAPHSGRDVLRHAVERARKLGSLITEES